MCGALLSFFFSFELEFELELVPPPMGLVLGPTTTNRSNRSEQNRIERTGWKEEHQQQQQLQLGEYRMGSKKGEGFFGGEMDVVGYCRKQRGGW